MIFETSTQTEHKEATEVSTQTKEKEIIEVSTQTKEKETIEVSTQTKEVTEAETKEVKKEENTIKETKKIEGITFFWILFLMKTIPGNSCRKWVLEIKGGGPLSNFAHFGFQTLESFLSKTIGSISKIFRRVIM